MPITQDIVETVEKLHGEFSMLPKALVHEVAVEALILLRPDEDLEDAVRHALAKRLMQRTRES